MNGSQFFYSRVHGHTSWVSHKGCAHAGAEQVGQRRDWCQLSIATDCVGGIARPLAEETFSTRGKKRRLDDNASAESSDPKAALGLSTMPAAYGSIACDSSGDGPPPTVTTTELTG